MQPVLVRLLRDSAVRRAMDHCGTANVFVWRPDGLGHSTGAVSMQVLIPLSSTVSHAFFTAAMAILPSSASSSSSQFSLRLHCHPVWPAAFRTLYTNLTDAAPPLLALVLNVHDASPERRRGGKRSLEAFASASMFGEGKSDDDDDDDDDDARAGTALLVKDINTNCSADRRRVFSGMFHPPSESLGDIGFALLTWAEKTIHRPGWRAMSLPIQYNAILTMDAGVRTAKLHARLETPAKQTASSEGIQCWFQHAIQDRDVRALLTLMASRKASLVSMRITARARDHARLGESGKVMPADTRHTAPVLSLTIIIEVQEVQAAQKKRDDPGAGGEHKADGSPCARDVGHPSARKRGRV